MGILQLIVTTLLALEAAIATPTGLSADLEVTPPEPPANATVEKRAGCGPFIPAVRGEQIYTYAYSNICFGCSQAFSPACRRKWGNKIGLYAQSAVQEQLPKQGFFDTTTIGPWIASYPIPENEVSPTLKKNFPMWAHDWGGVFLTQTQCNAGDQFCVIPQCKGSGSLYFGVTTPNGRFHQITIQGDDNCP